MTLAQAAKVHEDTSARRLAAAQEQQRVLRLQSLDRELPPWFIVLHCIIDARQLCQTKANDSELSPANGFRIPTPIAHRFPDLSKDLENKLRS